MHSKSLTTTIATAVATIHCFAADNATLPTNFRHETAVARQTTSLFSRKQNTSADQQERSEHEQKKLRRYLSDGLARGMRKDRVTVIPAITYDKDIETMLNSKRYTIPHAVAASPADATGNALGNLILLDERIYKSSLTPVEIPCLYLAIEDTKKLDIKRVTVWDHCTTQFEPIYSANLKTERQNSGLVAFQNFITRYLQHPSTKAQHEKYVAELSPSASVSPMIGIDRPRTEQIHEYATFPYAVSNVVLTCFPLRGQADNESFSTLLDHSVLAESVPRCNAVVEQLTFSVNRPYAIVSKNGHVEKIDNFPTEPYYDRHGNYIIRNAGGPAFDDTRYGSESIIVHPPYLFSTNASATSVPLSIDLTAVGLPDFKEFIRVSQLPLLSEDRGISIFSPFSFSELAIDQSKLTEVIDGILYAADLFGLKIPTDIDSLVIVDSHESNAYFMPASPRTVTILKPELKLSGMAYVGQHETFHLIDKYYQYPSTNKFFVSHHRDIGLNLIVYGEPHFYHLNETQFLKPITIQAGHAQDDSLEFFATLCNSLTHPHWDKAIASADDQFLLTYQKDLTALGKSLHSFKEKIPKMMTLLEVRSQRLAAIIEKKKIRSNRK